MLVNAAVGRRVKVTAAVRRCASEHNLRGQCEDDREKNEKERSRPR